MAIDYRCIGKNIRIHRTREKLTQSQFAEKLGCTPEHYSHIENGTRHIQFEMLVDVCRCLDISLEEALTGALDVPLRRRTANENRDFPHTEKFQELVYGLSEEKVEKLLEICREILKLPR